ncbi:mRNA cleavage factor complex component Pcf11 [Ophiocordyceps camponoti-floridani]|uniref:mRNA cleavage factor complex component Pcf11 n=1 Tax=Ophiocordyceps camponoti-floridani TaxID=2030778 RepID=A0A8H4VDJ5_9HYPO|nr:mRNA cleavage factor complex component Pcf11 [Ophiocordyceps camponoti-floridani]
MASDGDEVAEDYRHALEDLSTNMRFEISNLTVIARENTEHALKIAQVLQQHILKAPPNKKLPALYVLDSIVKNVGTPYTLYFGRNLFKTFMESYAVVDHNVRRKMEEMLRTWKDPVPGSMDTRPVFSHELVRPIENALIKARAVLMPQQPAPVPGRPRSAMLPQRNSATPPTASMAGQPYAPVPNGSRPGEPSSLGTQPVSSFSPAMFAQYPQQAPPQAGGAALLSFQSGPYGGISVETLNNDIHNLIVAMKAEFSHNPHDASVQNRLRALLDLQGLVQRTSLPPDQLELIKNKVTELAAVTMRPSSAQNAAQKPGLVPPQLQALAATPQPVSASPAQTPLGQAPVTLDSLLGPGALATLMARQSAATMITTATTSQNTTPYQAAIRSRPNERAAAPINTMDLLGQLRQAGMLPPAANAAAQPSQMVPPNIASLLSSTQRAAAAAAAQDVNRGLDAGPLKQGQFNPEAVAALYDELGPPCRQCGRRFPTDAEGKTKKTSHMDWHFRVHQRSSEAEKRGTHRSWYVDQQDWVRSREAVDSDRVAAPEETSKEASQADKGPAFIAVPEANSGVHNVCPICQEKFENKWLDTAQEWVWLDAVLVGNRAFHASCHAEATLDREGTPVASSRRTPELILGKRKAETSMSSPKVRAMKTSA